MKKIVLSLLKSELKKEARIPLIFITVVITTMAIFTSLNMVGLLKDSMIEDIKRTKVGNSDYVLYDKNLKTFKEIENNKTKSMGVINTNAVLKNKDEEVKCNLWGVNLEDFKNVFGEISNENSKFTGKNIIIDKETSEKLNLREDDKVNTEINGVKYELKVTLIEDNNEFINSNTNIVLINKEELENIFKISGNYVTSQYLYDCDISKSELEEFVNNDEIIVEKSIDDSMINKNIQSYYGVFSIIFVLIFITSMDILMSSNKLFIIERSNYIGALRSMGVTKRKIKTIFYTFSSIITIFASILGILLGQVALVLYNRKVIGREGVSLSYEDLIIAGVITLIIGLLISLYSTYNPLKKILKKSDKDIMLESTSVYVDNSLKPIHYVSIIVIILSLIIVNMFSINNGIILGIILIATFISLLNSLKIVYWVINKIVNSKPRKGAILIGVKNTINNFFVRKTISTTIKISMFLLILSILSFSMFKALSSFYYDYKATAFIRSETYFKESDLENIKQSKLINDYYFYNSSPLLFNDKKTIDTLSIDDAKKLEDDFINLKIEWLVNYDYNSFNEDKNIIPTKILTERYGLKLGDFVECSDGKTTQKYKIVGIADTMQELGDIAYISNNSMPFEKSKKINGVFLKGDNNEKVINEISEKITSTKYKYKSITEMIEKDQKNSKQLFSLFYIFAAFIALSNLVGIQSNYKLSYIFRRKEMATMHSYGYSDSDLIKIVVSEVIFSSIIGFIYAFGSTLIIINILEKLMKAVEVPIPITYSAQSILILFLIILSVTIINLSLAVRYVIKSKKNLIESLKEQ